MVLLDLDFLAYVAIILAMSFCPGNSQFIRSTDDSIVMQVGTSTLTVSSSGQCGGAGLNRSSSVASMQDVQWAQNFTLALLQPEVMITALQYSDLIPFYV